MAIVAVGIVIGYDWQTDQSYKVRMDIWSGEMSAQGILTTNAFMADEPAADINTALIDFIKVYILDAWGLVFVLGDSIKLINPVREVVALVDGLVSLWKLDEASGTRYDAVGTNHLTDNNTVTSAPGKIGDAAQFTAPNSESLSIADNPSLRVGVDSFTISAWIYVDSGVVNKRIVYKYAADTAGYSLWLHSSQRLRMNIGSAGGGTALIDPTNTLSLSTWYFVLAGVDAPNSQVFCQVNNGTAVTQALVSPQTDGPETFYIGSTPASEYWDGRIWYPSLYKRLLTAAEKSALYNAGAGLAFPYAAPS